MTESLRDGDVAVPDFVAGRMFVMEAREAVNPAIQLDPASPNYRVVEDKLNQYQDRLDTSEDAPHSEFASNWLKKFIAFHALHSQSGAVVFDELFTNMQASGALYHPRLRAGILEKSGLRHDVSDTDFSRHAKSMTRSAFLLIKAYAEGYGYMVYGGSGQPQLH